MLSGVGEMVLVVRLSYTLSGRSPDFSTVADPDVLVNDVDRRTNGGVVERRYVGLDMIGIGFKRRISQSV